MTPETVICAFGTRRTIAEWAKHCGRDVRTLVHRFSVLSDLPTEFVLLMPARAGSVEAEPGAPRSWTWCTFSYERDPWAQEFVEAHPSGATLEEVAQALGTVRERVRQIEEAALAKLRARRRCFDLGAWAALQRLRDARAVPDYSEKE